MTHCFQLFETNIQLEAPAGPESPSFGQGRVKPIKRLGQLRLQHLNVFLRDESGQDVVEYGLLIATIAIVVLIGVGIFGNNINAWFQSLAGRITTTGT